MARNHSRSLEDLPWVGGGCSECQMVRRPGMGSRSCLRLSCCVIQASREKPKSPDPKQETDNPVAMCDVRILEMLPRRISKLLVPMAQNDAAAPGGFLRSASVYASVQDRNRPDCRVPSSAASLVTWLACERMKEPSPHSVWCGATTRLPGSASGRER